MHSINFDLDSGKTVTPRIDNSKMLEILGKVWAGYKDFTAESLVSREHREGTAWSLHYRENSNTRIPDNAIENDFYKRITRYINAQNSRSTLRA
jgi:uncharacterized phage-associated protein